MQNKYKIGKGFIVRLLKAFMALWQLAQSQKQEEEIKEKVCGDDTASALKVRAATWSPAPKKRKPIRSFPEASQMLYNYY